MNNATDPVRQHQTGQYRKSSGKEESSTMATDHSSDAQSISRVRIEKRLRRLRRKAARQIHGSNNRQLTLDHIVKCEPRI
jgi:hypothetical protein